MKGLLMKLLPLAAAALLCAAVPLAFAGTLKPPAHAAQPSEDSGNWMDDVAGKKLFAVDGSTVTLTQADGGFVLDTIAPDGTGHDMSFNLLSDNLGSITEGSDSKTVTGVFRIVDNAIEANFADGRAETVASNPAGGLTVLLDVPDAKSWCMRWYPQGHGFDDADKKAALAEYASKLGLASAAHDRAVTRASCIETGTSGRSQPVAMAAPARHGLAEPISVRTSQVHLIDPPVATTPAQVIAPPPVKSADLAADRPPTQNHGASSCLKIDNDGASWGFRNSCGYGVQYAWCLEKGQDRTTACGTGTGAGRLDANGFAALMPANATVDADNQFRWVACTGGTGVSAQLDRADPPAGRCVITSDQ
jgi:hypothetical protein